MNSKYYKTIVFLRKMSVMLRRFTLPVQLIKTRFYKSPSYYPELPRKTRVRIFGELLAHTLRYGSIEWHYFSYGFDIKCFRKMREYMDESSFIWQNNVLNAVQSERDYTCILRDKTLFAEVLTMWGFYTPHTVAEIKCRDDLNRFLRNWKGENLFCKPIDGECGHGAFKVLRLNEVNYRMDGTVTTSDEIREKLKTRLSITSYIIQNIIEQLPEISVIYPYSLNTLRITTYYDRTRRCAEPFCSFFRTGAKGGEVDNWAVGGILIGVNLISGKLNKYGFYKHGYGGRTDKHPDTGFVFEDYQLPCYSQAIQLALSLHEKMKGVPVIGWDIAFTKEGVCFIEGNDNVEIGPMQIAMERGLEVDYALVKKRCLGY